MQSETHLNGSSCTHPRRPRSLLHSYLSIQKGHLREAWLADTEGLSPIFHVREECLSLSGSVYAFTHTKPGGMQAHQDAESRGFNAVLCLRATTDGSSSSLDFVFEEDQGEEDHFCSCHDLLQALLFSCLQRVYRILITSGGAWLADALALGALPAEKALMPQGSCNGCASRGWWERSTASGPRTRARHWHAADTWRA